MIKAIKLVLSYIFMLLTFLCVLGIIFTLFSLAVAFISGAGMAHILVYSTHIIMLVAVAYLSDKIRVKLEK